MRTRRATRRWIAAALAAGLAGLGPRAHAAPEYHAIQPTLAGATVTVTGHDLTIDQVAQVARQGAKVRLSAEAKQRQADTYSLVNEGAAEGVPIYLFNRNPGFMRETARFVGDPLSPENRPKLEQQALAAFKAGAYSGDGPEIEDEDKVRAIMLVFLSQITYRPASPELAQAVVDFLNDDITPVVQSRGGTGEAQGAASGNIEGALVGVGDVFYRGRRMPAADALRLAGLQPLRPHPSDGALGANNADVAGLAALVVYDAKQLLDWIDLAYAIDLNGMNSSVTPLFSPVQANRPYPWINWDAARVLGMLKGSYLFGLDKTRIIQDPESLRAGYVRQGAAWQAWAALRDDVVIQMNRSDGNPAATPNVTPAQSWELSTPWAMQYHVKGDAAAGAKSGYVFSNANWDPYPLGDSLEAFTIALANLDVSVMLRQERFESPFFTVVKAPEVLKFDDDSSGITSMFNANHEVYQRIQGLMVPVPPEGYSSDPEYDQELDAETLFKVERADKAVEESWKLAATDLLSGARWMDVRKAQDPSRAFGAAPTAAVAALRQVAPLEPRRRTYAGPPPSKTALNFIKSTPAASFLYAGPAMPGGTGAR
jgi:histidine ammonia-lyase